MAYTVLARRYRSMTFDEVVGQEAIARTLKNAIEQNRVAHAYLFCGTRGVGKTTVARILARALNCEKGPTPAPCGKCDICQSIHRGDDVDVLEIDGASNTGVDDVRVLRDNAHYRPARARYKIYYIDEVHMLSRNAFNALLKTLEEPPEHVKFIFSTTEPERLPATILSRCQRFDFRAVPTDRIAEHLAGICKKEKVKADADALLAVAREGRGSVRDALTLLDQVIAVGDGRVTLESVREMVGAVGGGKVLAILDACAAGDAGRAVGLLGDLLAAGIDLGAALDQLMREVRDLLVVKTCGPDAPLLDVFGPDRKAMAAVAEKLTAAALVAAMGYLAEARTRTRWAVDGRPMAELALVRMASLAEMEALPEVLGRLEAIERSLGGAGAAGRPPEGAGPAAALPSRDRQAAGTQARGPASAAAAPPSRPAAPARPPAAESDEKKKTVAAPPAAGRPAAGRPAAAEPGADAPPPARRHSAAEAAADPFVQKTVRLFEGRIVNPDR
jgi:DNA polymerase-3 subunit gamma/tau